MLTSNRTTRAVLLTLAFALSGLALRYVSWAAECTPPAGRWIFTGVCCGTFTSKQKHQVCVQGSWVDDGATRCSGPCPM